jgi:hypothetical protein
MDLQANQTPRKLTFNQRRKLNRTGFCGGHFV